MRPHAQDSDGPLLWKDLVDNAMLDVDTAGVGAREISNELFVGWWILERVVCQDGQQFLCLLPQAAGDQLLCVLDCMLGEDKLPAHHFKAFALFERGSAIPALMDSRMPGTASKYKVS